MFGKSFKNIIRISAKMEKKIIAELIEINQKDRDLEKGEVNIPIAIRIAEIIIMYVTIFSSSDNFSFINFK